MKTKVNMEKQFKLYCEFLSKDREGRTSPNRLETIKNDYLSQNLDFYSFLNEMHQYNKTLTLFSKFLAKTGLASIEINDNRLIFTTNVDGIKLMFDGEDRRGVPFEFINFGDYEKEERLLFDNLLSDKMTILDIGANIGWYSILWGKKYKKAKIYTYEPVQELFETTIANLLLNGVSNVQVIQTALSDARSDMIDFNYSPECSGLSSIRRVMGYSEQGRISVNNQTLADSISELNIGAIDVIKCDVEGAEYNVIKGGIECIKKHLPILVLELYHEWSKHFGYHPDEPIKELKALGYEVFLPKQGKLEKVDHYIGEDFERQNYFFLHQNKHFDLIEDHRLK